MLRHFEKDARIALLLFHQQTGYDSVPGSENIELSTQDIDTIKDVLLKSVLTPIEAEQRLLEYQARMPHNKLKCICACCQEERYSEKLYIHYDVSKLQLLKVPQAQISKYKKNTQGLTEDKRLEYLKVHYFYEHSDKKLYCLMEYLMNTDHQFPICPTCSESLFIRNKIPKWSYVSER